MTRKNISHVSFEDDLLKRLKDPVFRAHYLDELIQDTSEGAKERLLIGVRRIAQAEGFKHVAEEVGCGRESLYKTLSKNGNPMFDTFISVIRACKITLHATTDEPTVRRKTKKAV